MEILLWPFLLAMSFGIWPILFFSALLAVLILCETIEYPNVGVAVLLICSFVVFWATGFNVYRWIVDNPGTFFTYAGYYFGIGLFWMGAKWYGFNKAEAVKNNFNRKNRPSVIDHYNRLEGWFLFWWSSMLRFVLGDLLAKFGRAVVNLCRGMLDYLGDLAWGKDPKAGNDNGKGDNTY